MFERAQPSGSLPTMNPVCTAVGALSQVSGGSSQWAADACGWEVGRAASGSGRLPGLWHVLILAAVAHSLGADGGGRNPFTLWWEDWKEFKVAAAGCSRAVCLGDPEGRGCCRDLQGKSAHFTGTLNDTNLRWLAWYLSSKGLYEFVLPRRLA